MNNIPNNQTDNILTKYSNNFIKGTRIDIFGNFDDELHLGKYFIHLYGDICNTYSVYASIDLKNFLKKITEKFQLTDENFILKEEQAKNKSLAKVDYTSSAYLIILKEKILLEINSYKAEFWYGKDIDFENILEVVKLLEQAKKKKKHKQKFYMVSVGKGEGGLEFKKFDIKKMELNIDENYNNDFIPVHNTISEFLQKEDNNGLVLLHGKYGTGKTTYIRYLMSTINKRFIFLPLNLMEAMSSPSFLPFISKFKDSILILEDCEDLLKPRISGNTNNNSLVNLLNLGDGLLSDAFSFKIICTFNANLRQIDQAILRKGRLIARYEFDELSVEKAQNLWNKLNIEGTIEKPTVLSEIYNKNAQDFGEISSKKMGFN
jgi:hypothetical protein